MIADDNVDTQKMYNIRLREAIDLRKAEVEALYDNYVNLNLADFDTYSIQEILDADSNEEAQDKDYGGFFPTHEEYQKILIFKTLVRLSILYLRLETLDTRNQLYYYDEHERLTRFIEHHTTIIRTYLHWM